MNVYDFDRTIYKGYSSVDFFAFCLFRNIKVLRFVPRTFGGLIRYKLHLLNMGKQTNSYCDFLTVLDDVDKYIELFWDKNIYKISEWYLKQQKDDDIVITSSPSFLLLPICKRLNIKNLVATNIDKKTGKLIGKFCYGKEKTRKLAESFPDIIIDNFYTDSISDKPLMDIAKKAYIIKNDKIIKQVKKD